MLCNQPPNELLPTPLKSADQCPALFFTLDLEPGELIQDLEPFVRRASRPNFGWGLARAEVMTGSGVLVSASVIDSRTNDATTVPMQRQSSEL